MFPFLHIIPTVSPQSAAIFGNYPPDLAGIWGEPMLREANIRDMV